MPEPRLFFSSPYLEALFEKSLKHELTLSMREELAGLGLRLNRPLEPAYPAEMMAKCIELLGRQLFPDKSRDDALRIMGNKLFEGWSRTMLGAAATGWMRVVGPLSSLKRMGRNFRTGDNFTEVKFVERGKGDCEQHFNEVLGMPSYYAGILEAGARAIGAKNTRVDVIDQTPPGAVLRVQWDA